MRFGYAAVISLVMVGVCSQVYGTVRLASWRGDLDGDKVPEVVEITRARVQNGHPIGGEVIVCRNGRARPVWRHRGLNPWKLLVADVDGDGKKDVVIGVWKKSPRDQVMARRVFVYSWDGRRLVPKWLGSRLSRRFTDFAVVDVDHDGLAELFALEIMPGGKHRISEYRWRSFGFDWLGSTAELVGVTALREGKGGIEMIEAAGKWVKLDLTTIRYWRRDDEDS